MATFKKIRQITLGVLKLSAQPRYIYIMSQMYIGEKIANSKMAPATLMHAIDMETGEEGLILCASVLQKELLSNYGASDYVRRAFEITQHKAAKGYNLVQIAEVGVPDDFEPPKTERSMSDGKTLVLVPRTKDADADEDEGDEGEEAPPKRAGRRR